MLRVIPPKEDRPFWQDHLRDRARSEPGLLKRLFLPRKAITTKDTKRGVFDGGEQGISKYFVRYSFPINFVTAPLIADLFLLAISAIGRNEVLRPSILLAETFTKLMSVFSQVYDGTIGSDNIHPIDIMAFFITLAYIAISIDASGLIRYLAFKVLQKGGKNGQLLFCYLYMFFFGLASFIGNVSGRMCD
jgi:hypothetical protein